jgi:hypothetical protein
MTVFATLQTPRAIRVDSEELVAHVFVYAQVVLNLAAVRNKHIAFRSVPHWNTQLRWDLMKNLAPHHGSEPRQSLKLLFSHPELVHDLLVEFVSVVRSDTLHLDTLQRVNGSYTSETGDARYEDMVWKVRLADRWLYVYLLLEFQSRSDDWMARIPEFLLAPVPQQQCKSGNSGDSDSNRASTELQKPDRKPKRDRETKSQPGAVFVNKVWHGFRAIFRASTGRLP